MKYKELAAMDAAALDKKLAEIQLELIKLNAQVASGTAPKNSGTIRQLKKTIAKILTSKRQSAAGRKPNTP